MRKLLSPSVRWLLKVGIIILGLFAVITVYFWAHKPFDSAIIIGLARSLSSVGGCLVIILLGFALGQWSIGRWLNQESPVNRLALATGVGLGFLSLLMLGLGLVGLLNPFVAWGIVLILVFLLRRHIVSVLACGRAILMPNPEYTFQRWVFFYTSVSLLLTFFIALAPPVGWDTLAYHLTGPRLFVEAGRIVHPIDLPYLGFPQLMEMQFTLGLLLVGDRVAPLLHFSYGLMALVIIVALARRFGRNVGWWAIALFMSVPTLLSLMTRAYVDVALLFYVTAAFYAFIRWRDLWKKKLIADNRGWLVVIGLFCGFCGWVKYTSVIVPITLGLSLMWVSRRDGFVCIFRRVGLVAIVALLVVLPGLLENMWTTGNPVYPFFFDDGLYWDEWRAWWFGRPGTGLAATAPWRLLTAPFEATVLGTEGTIFYEATIGPLILPSVLLLVFVWRTLNRVERSITGYLLLLVGSNYILWLNGLARTAKLLRTRFLFLIFGLLAVLGGLALDHLRSLRRPQLAVDWLVRAVVSVTLALLLFSTVFNFLRINPLPVIVGLETRDDYLTRRLGLHYIVLETINRDLPSDASVLFLWEPRSYYCQIECWPDAMLDRFMHAVHLHGRNAADIAHAWRTAGVTHVLLYQDGLDLLLKGGFEPITSLDLKVLAELEDNHMMLIEGFGSAYILYQLE